MSLSQVAIFANGLYFEGNASHLDMIILILILKFFI